MKYFLQPKNILMGNGGTKVVLADFGIVSLAMVETSVKSEFIEIDSFIH